MILLKNVEVYSPTPIGKQDLLISGETIALMETTIESFHSSFQVIDGAGKRLLPGFLDQHVHITGGGGEGSFKTRVPEITLSKLVLAGITTVVGLLGTDASTRGVENLVAKAKALKEEGVSAYVVTGSYEYPTVTLTGSVRKDIVFIDEVLGAKVALSDHRSSHLTFEELARLASDVRVAGMIGGKPGILIAHMGDGKSGMQPIMEIMEKTDLPISVIHPTHVNRKESLLLEAFKYAKMGGMIDVTCGASEEFPPGKIIKKAKELGVPLENITASSDGYGSWSNYDQRGNLIEIGVSQVDSLWNNFVEMVQEDGFTMEEALPHFTSNVAKGLHLDQKKGIIRQGADADLLLVDENLQINTVIARGKIMMQDKKLLVKGTYED